MSVMNANCPVLVTPCHMQVGLLSTVILKIILRYCPGSKASEPSLMGLCVF